MQNDYAIAFTYVGTMFSLCLIVLSIRAFSDWFDRRKQHKMKKAL